MMEKVRLGDICNILNGYAFKSSEYKESGIRVIRITNVQSGYIEDKEPKYYSFEKKTEIEKYMLKDNDILISLTGNVGRVGLLKREMLPAALNQRVACIRIKENKNISIDYIFNILNTKKFLKQCEINSKGIAQKNLSTEWLKNYLIDIPDFRKQAEISNKLDKVQKIIDLRKKQIEELDGLIKSKFVEMFGNLENNKWKMEKLDNVTFKITDGKHGGCKRKENSGYYFVGATEIYNDRINYEMANQITEEEFKKDYNRCDLKIDDFVIVNTGATIGKNAIVDDKICNNILLQKSVALIRVNKQYMLPIYLKYCYDCNPSLYSKGQGCARVNLLLSQIRNTTIPMPPIELQNQFEEFVKQINRQKFIIKKSLKETEELQESLMNKYFE